MFRAQALADREIVQRMCDQIRHIAFLTTRVFLCRSGGRALQLRRPASSIWQAGISSSQMNTPSGSPSTAIAYYSGTGAAILTHGRAPVRNNSDTLNYRKIGTISQRHAISKLRGMFVICHLGCANESSCQLANACALAARLFPQQVRRASPLLVRVNLPVRAPPDFRFVWIRCRIRLYLKFWICSRPGGVRGCKETSSGALADARCRRAYGRSSMGAASALRRFPRPLGSRRLRGNSRS